MASLDDPPEQTALLTDETAAIVASFNPTLLTEYLTELAGALLNASREDLQVSLLSYPDIIQRCSRFATDPNNLVLYLRKELSDASAQNGYPESKSLLNDRSRWTTVRVLLECRVFC